MQMCLLCIEFKQVFPAEHRLYTQKEYETHLRTGDGDGSKGHPNCEFCKKVKGSLRIFKRIVIHNNLM